MPGGGTRRPIMFPLHLVYVADGRVVLSPTSTDSNGLISSTASPVRFLATAPKDLQVMRGAGPGHHQCETSLVMAPSYQLSGIFEMAEC